MGQLHHWMNLNGSSLCVHYSYPAAGPSDPADETYGANITRQETFLE